MCGTWDLCRVVWDLSLVAPRLSSCGTWAPEPAQAFAVRGLSCPVACGILVSQIRIEPVCSALQGGFLITGSPGKFPGV